MWTVVQVVGALVPALVERAQGLVGSGRAEPGEPGFEVALLGLVRRTPGGGAVVLGGRVEIAVAFVQMGADGVRGASTAGLGAEVTRRQALPVGLVDGRRQVLLISSDEALEAIPHPVAAIRLTTWERPWATRVMVTGADTGLDRRTWASCEQVRAVSTQILRR